MNLVALLTLFIGCVVVDRVRLDQFNGISGCRTTKLDLIFVVDGSSSDFEKEYNYVRIWIQNVTSHFDVSSHTTRVAAVQSGDTPYTEFGFDDLKSTEEVFVAVNNIQFGTGTATTQDILHYVKDHVVRSARPDASVIVLILSDGRIQHHNDVHRAARQLHDMGVTTFAIGAGETMSQGRNVEYLKAIASDPMEDHLFVVRELRNIATLERFIISEVCKHTVQECPTASHDLAFIIDGSSTIGYKNFEKVKTWMKKIVEAFDVRHAKTRIAVIQYSTNVQEEISFNDNLTKAEVLEKIGRMQLLIGDTHTGHALEYCMKVIFSDNYGSRNNVPDVVIVMTDGRAQDHEHVVTAAKLVHDAGIEVYAMGIGDDYSLEEIKDIASVPHENHIILANSFQQIDLQRIGLIKRICEESEPGCPNTAADIVFLVDNRVAIGEDNVQNVKAWLKSAVDYLEVGQHYSRIGLVRYGALPELLFELSEYSSTSQVISAISKQLNTKNTNENELSATGIAIHFVKTVLFGKARTGVPRFLIILTSGESSDDFSPAVKRAEKAGIKIFSFGLGEVNLDHLQALASASNYVFHDNNFDGIRRQLGSFMSALCEVSEPACSIQEIDLQFVVDGSDNITPGDFEKVKRWIRNVIRSFDIGNYTTRVGLTQYSSTIQNVFNMNSYKTRREIEHAVEMIQLVGGSSHTGMALEHVMEHSFSEKAGSRQGAAKVLVILSDGNSADSIIAGANKIHEAGIRVFAVGAGSNTERAFLETLATEPILTHVTESASYDAINTVRQQIVGEICRETKSECPEAEMDLIFLVDGSTAIGSDSFHLVKSWLISFVNQFEIGEYNSKIGLIQYADKPRLDINLKKASDKETLMKAILNVEHLTGMSNTGAALEYARSQGFSDKTSREKTPKVVIVLTNGRSNDDVITPAQNLMSDGVILYAVGVGNTNQRELRSLASTEDNVLHVRNVDAIPTIHSSLVRRVCQGVQTDCRENATDIVMLIDGSYSVGHGSWGVVKSFMRNITERFEIGPEAVQVGVVQYASTPRIEFALNEHQDFATLHKAMRNLEWMMGDTHTARALRFTREHVLSQDAGARAGVSKLLLIVTDGDPQDSDDVREAAAAIRSDGWRTVAIGVGEASLPELHVLASKPAADHVFHADDFESTRKLKGRLFRMICTERAIETDDAITGKKSTENANTVIPDLNFDVTGDEVGHVEPTGFDVDAINDNTEYGPGENSRRGGGDDTDDGPGKNSRRGGDDKTEDGSGKNSRRGGDHNTEDGRGKNSRRGGEDNTEDGPGKNSQRGGDDDMEDGPGSDSRRGGDDDAEDGRGKNSRRGGDDDTEYGPGNNSRRGGDDDAEDGPGKNSQRRGDDDTEDGPGKNSGRGGEDDVTDFDILADQRHTLELKQPITVDIRHENVTGRSFPPAPEFDIDLKKAEKGKRPKDKQTEARYLTPGALVATGCPVIKGRGEEVIKGWDYLKEMGVVHPKSSAKPKRSALIKRFINGSGKFQSVKIDLGSTENHTSYRIPSSDAEFRPLSRSFHHIFHDPWRFVAVFRLQYNYRNAQWTLVNITDDVGNTAFAVTFNGNNQTVSIDITEADGLKRIELPSSKMVKTLFDTDFHKLEISANNSQVYVTIDCYTVKRDSFRLPAVAPTSYVGSWMTSQSVVIVNVQDIFFKCYPPAKEECCEIPFGALCGEKKIPGSLSSPPVSIPTEFNERCTCPPGPAGPPGPPGKTFQRVMKGKPGPRGPPGKTTSPVLKKSTIRHIVKKVATVLIQDEMRKMYQVILDSITDDGRMDAKVIQGVLSKYDRRAFAAANRKAAKGIQGFKANHRKSDDDPLKSSSDDCGDEPCYQIPDAIPKELD